MKSILLVDDDRSVRDYLEETLSGEDFDVRTAADGPSGLAAALEKVPDLVLLDVQMPGMSGYEVLRALRAEPATVQVPVAFLTVEDAPEAEEHGLSVGVVDYISKAVLRPDRVKILVYRLRNFLVRQENERLCGALAAMVAANHEINNALMVVQGSADLMRMRGAGPDSEDGKELLDRLMGGCAAISDVLIRMRSIGRFATRPYLRGVTMLDLSPGLAEGVPAAADDRREGAR